MHVQYNTTFSDLFGSSLPSISKNQPDDELRIVKWGRNASYGSIPTRLRGKGKGGHAIYRNASALECVVGYLYMTDLARLEFIMADLGVAIDNVAGDK